MAKAAVRAASPAVRYLIPPKLTRSEEAELVDLWEPVIERRQGSLLAEHPEIWAIIGTAGILGDRIMARVFGSKGKD